MKYTVVWQPKAEQRLAAACLIPGNGTAVTRAVYAIDTTLSRYPAEEGESRDGLYRVLIRKPLTVYFRVDEVHRIVWVVDVVHHPAKT